MKDPNLPPEYQEESEIDTGRSEVLVNPKKNLLIIIGAVVASIFFVYWMFFNEKDTKKKNEPPKEVVDKTQVVKPAVEKKQVEKAVPAPALPAPPPLVAPELPPPPAPIAKTEFPAPSLEMPKPEHIESAPPPVMPPKKDNGAKDMKRKASIMLTSGGGGGAGSSSSNLQGSTGKDALGKDTKPPLTIESDEFFTPERTPADQQRVTKLGNTAYVVAQGKIIDAVLETAINTDLSGTVRAIVSRDVYAESGKNILIPKGSRLIGTYPNSVSRGQQRLSILFHRLIRPDGYDVIIDSGAIDKIGRAGAEGILDNKYFEILANAALLSTVNIAVATATQKMTNAQVPATTITPVISGTGVAATQTQTGQTTVAQQAIQDAVKSFGDTTKQLTQDAIKTTPTISIDQGTIIKVFVNRDLIFPADLANKHMVN